MSAQPSTRADEVTITGVDIPFIDLVMLLFKTTLASIPAGLMLGLLGGFLYLFWMGLVARR